MREGHCQLRNWQVEVPQTVLTLHKFKRELTILFCMRLVVKKWIPQYEVAVLKKSEIFDFVESRSNTEKVLPTSKLNLLMLFLT